MEGFPQVSGPAGSRAVLLYRNQGYLGTNEGSGAIKTKKQKLLQFPLFLDVL